MLFATVKTLDHLLYNLSLTGWLTVGGTIPSLDLLSDSSLSDYFSSASRVGLVTISVSSDPLKHQKNFNIRMHNVNLHGKKSFIYKKIEIFTSVFPEITR